MPPTLATDRESPMFACVGGVEVMGNNERDIQYKTIIIVAVFLFLLL